MNKIAISSLAVLALLSFACGTAQTDASQEGDDTTTEGALTQVGASASNAHLAAVGKCQKLHAKAADAATSTAAMIKAQSDYTACLKNANNGVVSRIEANLADAGSTYRGKTTELVAAFRTSGTALCAELDKASPNFGGSLSAVQSVGCTSDREALLSNLIDTYVSLGEESASIKEDRAHHKSCYRIFDRRLDTAVANNDMAQAVYALAGCVSRRTSLLASPLARVEVQNDASAGPESAAADRVSTVTDDVVKKGGALCALLNEAGDNGTGTASRLTTGSCEVNVAEAVFVAARALLDSPEGG